MIMQCLDAGARTNCNVVMQAQTLSCTLHTAGVVMQAVCEQNAGGKQSSRCKHMHACKQVQEAVLQACKQVQEAVLTGMMLACRQVQEASAGGRAGRHDAGGMQERCRHAGQRKWHRRLVQDASAGG